MLVLLVLRGLRRVGCWSEFVLRCVVKSVVRGVLLLAPAGWLVLFGRLLLCCCCPGAFDSPCPGGA